MGDLGEALHQLKQTFRGEVDNSTRRRAEYSSDASNYRIVPGAVIFPRDADDVAAAIDVAQSTGIPLTPRGAGTSIAGNAIGPGLVLDLSRHMRHYEVDPVQQTALVQPGAVLADLQAEAALYGLRFGPDPSTSSRCTIGGMIGNNACGARSLAFGRTSDNVLGLDAIDGRGRRLSLDADPPDLEAFTHRWLATIRTEMGTFARQASGYALEHLLPERGARVSRALVGSEGTCAITVSATLNLVPIPGATTLVVLGYPDLATAADEIGAVLEFRPHAVEGMYAGLVEHLRRGNRNADLPAGGALLFVELGGENARHVDHLAHRLVQATGAQGIVADAAWAAQLWRLREDAVGLAGRTVDGAPAWPGWEDAAVPPARLGDYLRAFDELKLEHRVNGLSYGHVGEGCVHTRLDFPLADAPDRFHEFLVDAAKLVVTHGGSLSGEHGDGRARSELLPLMYSADALRAFAEFKALFDPDGILNPGVLVAPASATADLRLTGARPLLTRGPALLSDGGDLSIGAHRCVGMGKCVATGAGVMCPSYRATGDEKDSTRGRARVLQEMANGTLVTGGWASSEVAASLDLCLSCKACAAECPAGVDVASYKSEVLYRRYRRRLRPVSHYSLGWLPRWLRLLSIAPRAVNALSSRPLLARLAKAVAGIDQRRTLPTLSLPGFGVKVPAERALSRRNLNVEEVVLWIDTFTGALAAEVGEAAVRVLESTGARVVVPKPSCCGLTFITTGQLDQARRRLRHTVATLKPYLDAGTAIVGLEPSCLAVLRSDVRELLPGDVDADRLSAHIQTLAEYLTARSWQPPDLTGVELLAQPHCHQHAVMGFDTDLRLLRQAGATVQVIEGCCGMAGNFGMEAGEHYATSMAVAKTAFTSAFSYTSAHGLLADGYSCRTQANHFGYRKAVHLAQMLDNRILDRVISDPSRYDPAVPNTSVG